MKDNYIQTVLKEADKKFYSLYEGHPVMTGSIRPMLNKFLTDKLKEAYSAGQESEVTQDAHCQTCRCESYNRLLRQVKDNSK